MYLNAEQKQIIIDTLMEDIPQLQALYLFGSYADGSVTNSSDIDVAYLSSHKISSVEKWQLSQKLALAFSLNVDLVELSTTNTIFRYQIISKGERIYGEGYEVENFETLAYSFYLRFQEERKPIVDAIMENKSVYGREDV